MKKVLIMMVALFLGMASVAMAGSITVDGSAGTLTTPSAVYYDNGAEAFTMIDTDGVDDNAFAILYFEIAGYADLNTFGLYTFDVAPDGTVSVADTLQIFSGDDSDGIETQLQFDFASNTVTNGYTGDFITLNANRFGFYLTSPYHTYYSHTELNGDDFDHFLTFDTRNPSERNLHGANVVLAMEDLWNGGDKDFQDMVVGITDIAPVPEPGTLALLGFGLLGLAAIRRRRS